MIEASRDAGVPVIVGGRGFGVCGEYARSLGANGLAPNAKAAIALLDGGEWPSFTDPAPPVLHPDDDYAELSNRSRAVVDGSMAWLFERFPPMAAYDDMQLDRTTEDLAHIVDFAAAALFIDDVSLFTEFVGWLADILVPREVPVAAARLGLEAVREQVPDLARARRFLTAGIDALDEHPLGIA